jgi:hypothetical protein
MCSQPGKRKNMDTTISNLSLFDDVEQMKQLSKWMKNYPLQIRSLLQGPRVHFDDIKSLIHIQVKKRIDLISSLDIGQFLNLKDFSLFRRCCKSTLSWKQSTSWKEIIVGKHSLIQLQSFLPEKQRIPILCVDYERQNQRLVNDFFHDNFFSFDTLDLHDEYCAGLAPFSLYDPNNFISVTELHCSLKDVKIIKAFLETNPEKKCLRLKWRAGTMESRITLRALKSFFSYTMLPSNFFVQDRLFEFGCTIREWKDLLAIWQPICIRTEVIRLHLYIDCYSRIGEPVEDKTDEFKCHVSESDDTFLRELHITHSNDNRCINAARDLTLICALCSPKMQHITIASHFMDMPVEFSKLELPSSISFTWHHMAI